MTGKTGQKCVEAGKYNCQTHPASTIGLRWVRFFPSVLSVAPLPTIRCG